MSKILEMQNNLISRDFVRVDPSSYNSVVNCKLLPMQTLPDTNPFMYSYKNALIELFLIKDPNMRMNYLTQLHLMIIANNDAYVGREELRAVKLVLFRVPVKGDKLYREDVNNILKKQIGNLDLAEKLIAFYNGIPIPITREFMSSVMNLKPNQTIREYLKIIGCRYTEEALYKFADIHFKMMASSMVDYGIKEGNEKAYEAVQILSTGKSLILLLNEELEVRLVKDDCYKLEIVETSEATEEETQKMGGLLEDTIYKKIDKYDIDIDPITANTLIIYYFQENESVLREADNFLMNILRTYPRVQREVEYGKREKE